jgi:hypothetical protein
MKGRPPFQGTPSEAARAGWCPSCLGTGMVHVLVPTEGLADCPDCGGTGRLPDGPVAPFYLSAQEAQTLAVACGLLMHLTEQMTDPETASLAEAVVAFNDGPAGTARLDQVVAKARERRPILRSLITALLELGDELDRETDRLRKAGP